MSRFITTLALLLAIVSVVPGQTNGTELVPFLKTATPSGALQPMNITQNTVIDTSVTPMPLEVLSLTIQAGVVLSVIGDKPFYVKAELDIFVFGTLLCSGLDGDFGGFGGPGGFDGGSTNQSGFGPFAGQPGIGQGGGGGAGNATAGGMGTGPGGGLGGAFFQALPFQTVLQPGSGGGGTTIPNLEGGGGGGILRLHTNSRIFISGSVLADGGKGEDTTGQFQAARGAGGGAGGSIELIAPIIQVSNGVVSAIGGQGGTGIFQDGGDGGVGFIEVRSNGLTTQTGFTPAPILRPSGATMTPECAESCISVQPDFLDFPAAFGAQAFLLFSGALLAPGAAIPLGGGKELHIDPFDALFDPAVSPLYTLLLGQGAPIGGSLETTVSINFGPLVAILASLGLEEFSIFTQAVLIKNGAIFDASNVTTLDYIAVD